MAYIDKESLLTAYKVLSHNTTSPSSQGATQFISAIRYLFALDRFIFKTSKNCDTKVKDDRELFIRYVGDIVSINGSYYTSNFFTDIKNERGYNVGSNFFSVNVVKESITNPTIMHDFPRRTKDASLFKVQNGVLFLDKTLYRNIKKYITSKECRVALAIWLCRKFNFKTSDINYSEIRNYLITIYSSELVNEFLSLQSDFIEYTNKNGLVTTSSNEAVCDLKEIYQMFNKENKTETNFSCYKYSYIITAIKSKPFLLLAGISGTGKSRIVRELARACWDEDLEEYKAQKPKNFEMVQVKPNWHDSSELIGYVSRVSGEPVYVAGDFLKFVAKAWENPEVPHFLCLDEMNLAPVEQYFAEYLSVVESRKRQEDGTVTTDPILKKSKEDWYRVLTAELTDDEEIRARFLNEGITIPQNLIVVGTVNMDETTFSFSRKVLDRAMTIEMNEVDLEGGLDSRYEKIGKLEFGNLIGTAVEGVDVYADNKEVCDKVIKYLKAINEKLEGTPFKVAYRTRNEFLLYVVNNLPYNKDENGEEISQEMVIARALDEITNMKILSRIEGDETKVSERFLNDLRDTIKRELNNISQKEYSGTKDKEVSEYSVSLAKLKEMIARLESGYTSFWS